MTFDRHELEADGFAIAAARIFRDEIAAAIRARGACHLALSGGKTPWLVLHQLADHDLQWDRVHLWQVDERISVDDPSDRYSVGLEGSLLARDLLRPDQVHLMDVDNVDQSAAAAEYAATLKAECNCTLDVVHLGLGTDGQTASWFPGDPGVDISDRQVAVLYPPGHGSRMTLTIPCVNAARRRLFLVAGDGKEDVLRRMLAGDPGLPASRVTTEGTLIVDSIAGRTF